MWGYQTSSSVCQHEKKTMRLVNDTCASFILNNNEESLAKTAQTQQKERKKEDKINEWNKFKWNRKKRKLLRKFVMELRWNEKKLQLFLQKRDTNIYIKRHSIRPDLLELQCGRVSVEGSKLNSNHFSNNFLSIWHSSINTYTIVFFAYFERINELGLYPLWTIAQKKLTLLGNHRINFLSKCQNNSLHLDPKYVKLLLNIHRILSYSLSLSDGVFATPERSPGQNLKRKEKKKKQLHFMTKQVVFHQV